MLHLYIPIAGNSVNVLLIFGLGGLVGILSGIFGVGGGFLMTPLLIMIGIPPTVAAASDSNQIVGVTHDGWTNIMPLESLHVSRSLLSITVMFPYISFAVLFK